MLTVACHRQSGQNLCYLAVRNLFTGLFQAELGSIYLHCLNFGFFDLSAVLRYTTWRFYVTNIFNVAFTPQVIYDVYASRWQIEIFFNIIKNVLKLDTIISRTKNGIMIEIYSALIFYLLVRIIMALAAQKTGKSIYELSFECSYKLVQGFMLSHFHRFLEPSLQAVEGIFQHMIDMVAMMGISPKKSQMAKLHECFA